MPRPRTLALDQELAELVAAYEDARARRIAASEVNRATDTDAAIHALKGALRDENHAAVCVAHLLTERARRAA